MRASIRNGRCFYKNKDCKNAILYLDNEIDGVKVIVRDMQTMLRMVGVGDNAGSGFPTIVSAWDAEGWGKPELIEDTILNQVTDNWIFVYFF